MNNELNNQIDTLDITEEPINQTPINDNNIVQNGETSIFNQQPVVGNEVETLVDNQIDTLEPSSNVTEVKQVESIDSLDVEPQNVENLQEPSTSNQVNQVINPNAYHPSLNNNQPNTTQQTEQLNAIYGSDMVNEPSTINETNSVDQRIIESNTESTEPRKRKGIVISKESIYILLVAALIYFILAPLIESYVIQKIIDYVVIIGMAAKAGVTLKIGISLYIKLIIATFIVTASFVFLLSSIINVVMGGRLFEEGKKFISKSMAICLLYSILVVILVGLVKIDLLTVTFRVAMLDGYQLFIFDLF